MTVRDAEEATGALPPAARVLWATLAATLLLRAAAVHTPGRWLWGVDLGRDLPPAAFWIPWLLAALALLPGVSRPLTRALSSSSRGTVVLAVTLALLAGALAWNLPDRLIYTGDESLRRGIVAGNSDPAGVIPQATVADLWLHVSLPRALAARVSGGLDTVHRVIGALDAVALGLFAWALARALRATGAAALAVIAAAGWTGALALFGGYPKSLVEVAVLATAAGAGLLGVARNGRGLAGLGLAAALALLLHREGLFLLPAWGLGLVLTLRRGGAAAWREPANWLGALAPVVVIAITGGRIASVLIGVDLPLHGQDMVHPEALLVSSAMTPARLVSAANLLLLACPLLPVLAVLLVRPELRARRAEVLALVVLVLPPLALLLFVRGRQGLPRDWDDYVLAGQGVCVAAAWAVGVVLETGAAARWLAVPVALVAIAPGVQWAWLQTDVGRGLTRVESVLEGPPARDWVERSDSYEFVGVRRFERREYVLAASAFRLSDEAAPKARVCVEWGMAEAAQRDFQLALPLFERAARLDSSLVEAWRGAAACGAATGNVPAVQRAAEVLERLEPRGELTADAREWLARQAAPTAR